VVNGKWIIQAMKEHVTSECFMHIGLGVFFTLLTLGIFLGKLNVLIHFDIPWLEVKCLCGMFLRD
jgi:hypothetical protein